MTEAIFEVYGDNGIQVTGDHFGFGLSAVGNITLTDDGQTHPQPIVAGTVSVQGVNPVIALRPQVGAMVTVERVSVSGGVHAFGLLCQSGQPVSVQYWIFDTAGQAALDPTMADLQASIHDALGVKTFDMAMSPMRVAEAWGHDLPAYLDPPPVGGAVSEIAFASAVPAGRTYAIVQSTLALAMETYDTGGYGYGQIPPGGPIIDPGGEEGPNATWRYQHLRSWRSAAGFTTADAILVGLQQFEFFDLGWQPGHFGAGHCKGYGRLDYLIIDVTNYIDGGWSDPHGLSVAVDALTRSVDLPSATRVTTIAPAASASASGGTAPYSYSWSRTGGSADIVPHGGADAASLQTRVTDQQPGSDFRATWRCRAQDALGRVGYGPEVTFRHAVTLLDYQPDPIVWSDLILNTNAASGYTQDVVRQIVGINQPITLRIAVGARSGAIDAASLGVGVSSVSATGPWRIVERVNALVDTYIDVTVQPGDWISLNANGETLSGRRDYLFGVFIDNLSDGAAQLGAFSASLTVDADNNHNVHDYIPDPVNWADASSSTNDAGGAVLTNYQTISGISDPITLRFVVGYSGNLSSGSFRVFSATRNAFLGALPLGSGQLDVTVNPGEQINLYCDAGTISGRRSGTWSVEVRNQFAGGGAIDTVTLSATVDADNNYNVPDPYIDPGAIALYSNNASSSSGDVSASFGGGYATGINQTVTLTAIISPVYRGGAVPSYFVVYVGSGSAGWDIGQTHDQSFSFEVQPGQYVGASASLSMFPGSGDAWAYWHVDLYNSTTGEYLSGFDGGLTTTR